MSVNDVISPEEITTLYLRLPRIIGSVQMRRDINHRAKGRMFEDEVIKAIDDIGYDCYRGLGSRLIIIGLSGVYHEHDILFVRRKTKSPQYLVECKWRRKGRYIGKEHVMIFDHKSLDIFFNRYIDGLKLTNLFRIFVVSQPLTLDAFKLCLTYGILVLQPSFPEFPMYSTRETKTISLPPLEWGIIKIASKYGDAPKDKEARSLLAGLYSLRKEIFRKCTSRPNHLVHRGNRLLEKYRQLIWEVETI